MQDPQQELFTAIKLLLEKNENGYEVCDSILPPEGTKYPFIYIGDSQLVDDLSNKTAIFGEVYQDVHVWSNNPRKRGTMSGLLLEIKNALYSITETEHFHWTHSSTSQQIMPDNNTKEPLLHAVISVSFRFS